jgi:hypothetical protein
MPELSNGFVRCQMRVEEYESKLLSEVVLN